MKRQFAVGSLGLFLACLVGLALFCWAGPRDATWKEVDEAIQKGQPKTAIENLDRIYAGALKDKNYPEAIKAVGKKIALEGIIQGNKPEEKITRMQAEIAKSPKEMQPVMTAILANWYWQFFQHNQWRFMQRTALTPGANTPGSQGNDILSWDLPRIMAEIDKHFIAALANEAELKKIPIAQYNDLIEKGTLPDTYRPTLYDFLAFEALKFYSSGEQAGAKAEDAFELTSDSPIFGSVEEFMAWDVKTPDADSLTVRAIRLYQNVLKIHKDDKEQSVFLDANLDRLQFGYNKAVGEDNNARYKAALEKFVGKWVDHETSTRARYLWGSVLQQEGELVAAYKIAKQGNEAFPKSLWAIMCSNLMAQITAQEVQVSVERVWNAPWPTIQLRFRNTTQVHLRLIRDDWTAHIKNNLQVDRAKLLAKKPDLQWTVKVPATEDYQQRFEEVPAPKDLKPGFYFLAASHDPAFPAGDHTIPVVDVWVSKLQLVMRPRLWEDVVDGFVLDGESGEPVAGADVKAWYRNNPQDYLFSATKTTQSDKNGMFRFAGVASRGCMVQARSQEREVATGQEYNCYTYNPKLPPEQTVFFTDRSLYRPGQTIQFKGICIAVDQDNNNYKTIPNRDLPVVFLDPNGKEVARQQCKSNDYGSFHGSFTAPRDRLMGQMILQIDGQPHSLGSFRVEEYKRPKFQTTLDAPKTAPRLNDQVNMAGKATAYTGAAIDGAKVRWRVVREVHYPSWWYVRSWWISIPTPSQEIAHGTATTAVDGGFKIEFTAKPDLSVSEKDEPTFHYTVTADVTDTTGETRSAEKGINVGYTALKAELTANDWQTDQKPVEITITTQTLDGEPQSAEGVVKVYRLKQPDKVVRPSLFKEEPVPYVRVVRPREVEVGMTQPKPRPDPTNPNSWELGEKVAEEKFETDKTGKVKKTIKLAAGPFRAVLESKDRFGKPVTALLPIQVLQPDGKKLSIHVPNVVAGSKWTVEPGEEFTALWGTGYDQARAFIEIERRRKPVQAFWTAPGTTQQMIKQVVTEAHRGGFTLRVTMVRENRAYLTTHRVDVPWSNKDLTVKWEHFTSKLLPGQKETWTAVVSGPDAKKAVAEMVATLYDESLDAYFPHNWMQRFGVFYHDDDNATPQFENGVKLLHLYSGGGVPVTITYRSFPYHIMADLWGYQYYADKDGTVKLTLESACMPAPHEAKPGAPKEGKPGIADFIDASSSVAGGEASAGGGYGGGGNAQAPRVVGPDLNKVTARKNLNETAFFHPHLISDADGRIKIEFTMPEALTQWKFMGFAHDNALRAGFLQDKVVTAKDLMVQPNPPRFLREGDVLEFTVKVSNQSANRLPGTVRLTLADARTGKSVDELLGNTKLDQSFDIPEKESRTCSWKLTVPDGLGPITYKAVGSTSNLSDGEEGFVPVLSRRILVTESLPLPIRGPATKQFEFAKLLKSGESKTLQSQTLTVQMVSNTSWYAVMALPYLMEYPYECSEQVFNRLYANELARHIANSDPKIREVFNQWRAEGGNAPGALDSPMEKNQDLKSVMLEETPWLRQAKKESQARRDVAILFDNNRLNAETASTLSKLAQMQYADGAWPWFPGGPPNEFITLYITTGFGRLRHLGVKVEMAPAIKSLTRLDGWIDRIYRDILRSGTQNENHLTPTIALYLYGRSFFLADKPIAEGHKPAVNYFLGQARQYWLQLANRQSQGHLALALKRFDDKETAKLVMKSIKERSVSNEEMGMFWRELEMSFSWVRAPIETQAIMIEAFDEVMEDTHAVEECKVWLLKQKQTQDWKTTKATADAIYALLLRGDNLLASDALVEMTVGGETIKPEKVEAGTGFYEQRFIRGDITPKQGEITVKKTDKGVAWGSIHWQYLEDMAKITPHEDTPLRLTKSLYTRDHAKKGPVLEPVKGPVKVGDELVVRVVLRVDRDMEYIHLKDYRGSGTEPVNVLSRYKYQDGLGYYESTRDTASHFFIDYLPKGTYVFEYATRVVHKGSYQTGIAEIQCMYAPEFNSHSESIPLEVK